MASHLMRLSRELRNQVYHHLWIDTKITFSFLEMEMHALYNGQFRHYTPVTGLPTWLLTSKTILAEGMAQLEHDGELVVEASNISLAAEPPAANTAKPFSLINPLNFLTLVLHSPDDAFLITDGQVACYDEPHTLVFSLIAEHFKANANAIITIKVEIPGRYDIKEYLFVPDALFCFAGISASLYRLEFRIEDELPEQDFLSPVNWFEAFQTVAVSLLGTNHRVYKKSYLDDEMEVAVDYFEATKF